MAETSGGAQHSNALKRHSIIALNTTQLPSSPAQLTDLLGGVFRRNLADSDLDALDLQADLEGTGIKRLHLDFTNCQIVPVKGEYQPQNTQEPPLEAFETGYTEYFNIQAHPLTIGDAPVDFRIEGRDLPLGWFRLPDDELGVGILDEPIDGGPAPTGKFSAEADPQDLAELVRALVKQSLPGHADVYRPRASVDQPGAEEFVLRASCKVRYKIFRVRLGVQIAGRLASNGLLSVERFSLRGSNWILRMFTRVFRRQLEKTHDLNEGIGGGSKLINLRFRSEEKLFLSGELR